MNKDALLATVIGFGVGLVIAAIVFLGPQVFKNMPKLGLPDLSAFTAMFRPKPTTPTPTPSTTKKDGFSIESPLPEAIEAKNETLVSGTAPASSIVVLEGETDETVIVANTDGAFAGKVTLREGKNEIIATNYDKEKSQSQSVTVYYTPEDF
jgi:hypothetical protein